MVSTRVFNMLQTFECNEKFCSTPPRGLTPPLWIGLNLCVAELPVPIWWRQLGRGDESEPSAVG